MIALTPAQFLPLVGTALPLAGVEPPLALTLNSVESLAVSQREGGGFALQLSGPRDRTLTQGTITLIVGGSQHEIFVVPITPRADAALYEAVFN